VLLLLAAAALSWPDFRATARLRALRRAEPAARRRPGIRPLLGAAPALVVLAAALGAVLAGPGGLLAGAGLAGVGVRTWRAHRRTRQHREHAAHWAGGVRLLVAELRAGAHPAAAAEGAAADAAPEVAGMLRSAAATARLGGDVAAALTAATSGAHNGAATGAAHTAAATGRMARAWALAERHGVALAELLDAVRRDVEHRAAFAREVDARMAGPRATAAVLAGLPVLGLLLGESAGAAPLAVLTGTPIGQVLLVAGAALLCAGTVWTGRLTRTAVLP